MQSTTTTNHATLWHSRAALIGMLPSQIDDLELHIHQMIVIDQ